MKILHTSDIHLQEHGDKRWRTLSNIIDLCKEKDIDVLVISGDLFNKNPKMKDLRSDLQDLFSGNDFDILIIPGNHDKEICSDMYFGENGIPLDDPSEPFEKEDVRFIGLPCQELKKDKVAEKIASLKDVVKEDKYDILLYHGELLDSFYNEENYGNEENNRYMPSKLCYFDEVNLDYILAGHFHNNSEIFFFNNGDGFFIYPGSPFPITKRETGKRKVNIFEVGEDPTFTPLNTLFYKKIEITLNPFEDKDPIEKIKNKCSNIEDKAKPLINISGYINSEKTDISEDKFPDKVREIIEECLEIDDINGLLNLSVMDISNILENDLFKEFMKKLEDEELPSDKRESVREAAIKSLMEMK